MTPAADRRPLVWLPRSSGRRVAFLGSYFLFLALLVAGGFKLFWSARAGVPLDQTPRIWDVYYPELRRAGVLEPAPDDAADTFDVLLLGASVVDPSFGSIEQRLRDVLVARLGSRQRLFNVSTSAHTTRDSLIKFQHLGHRHFDLVVVYHGINDIRMNNCRPGTFREDYSHCAWYRSFQQRLEAGKMSIGVTDQAWAVSNLISLGPSQDNLAEFGNDLRTPPAFRANLERIVDLAEDRGSRVVLMSFAWHIPADYSREAFDRRTLDYSFTARSCGVEMWGRPDNVRRTLQAHNAAVRDLAAKRNVLFVDMEAAVPRQGSGFIDPCHLTDDGCRIFVETLQPAVEQAVADWLKGRPR